MPRQQKKKTVKASEEKEKRIQAVSKGQSIRSAANEFGIAYSTLQDHCSGKLKPVEPCSMQTKVLN